MVDANLPLWNEPDTTAEPADKIDFNSFPDSADEAIRRAERGAGYLIDMTFSRVDGASVRPPSLEKRRLAIKWRLVASALQEVQTDQSQDLYL